MAGSAMMAVQTGIRNALLADATLVALLASATAIYDEAPQASALPYIALNDVSESAWSTFGKYGQLVRQSVQVWSEQARGFAQADAIGSRAAVVLRSPTGSTITVSGYNVAFVHHQGTSRIINDVGDGTTAKGVAVEFHVYVTEV